MKVQADLCDLRWVRLFGAEGESSFSGRFFFHSHLDQQVTGIGRYGLENRTMLNFETSIEVLEDLSQKAQTVRTSAASSYTMLWIPKRK